MKSQQLSKRRGSVSLVALLIVLAIGGLMIAFMQVGLSFTREQAGRLDREHAIELAEAGLAESLYAMRLGGTGNVATRALPATHGDGIVWTVAEDLGNDVKRVVSSAMYGRERVALALVVFHYEREVPSTALFSNNDLTLEAAGVIDSFDSAIGDYATLLAASGTGYVGDAAVVQTNGTLSIGSSTELHGDGHSGTGVATDVASSGSVSGSMEPMPETREMPPIISPVIAPSGAYSTAALGEVLPAGDYNFSSLTVGTGNSLTLTGPARYLIGDWSLLSNSALMVDSTAGPVEIYVSGDVDLASNSSINSSSTSATELALYFTGGPTQVADLNSNSEFRGTIYSPEGTVNISSNFEVYGAVSANEILVSANVQIHFDEALLNVAVNDEFIAGAWSLAPFPDRTLTANRGDPFKLVGFRPHELPKLADAHDLP